MASASEHADFEIPFKRRKHETDEIASSNNTSEIQFQDFPTPADNHLDVCEGTSTDSGFNEAPYIDQDSRTFITSKNTIKKITSDSQLIERIFAMRGIIDEKLWLELTCQLFTPPPRQRLSHISRFADVIRLIRSSRKILVLTGAGVSVSCGIPDFRSRDGIYARLAQDFPDLPDPHAMFDSGYFRQDPRPFFKFAKEIYPGRFTPSRSHAFIKALESHGRLLRNYTQNIDTLERAAGINRVIECHGSFAQATCTRCQFIVDAEDIREDIFEQRIPVCKSCNPGCPSILATDSTVNFAELVQNGIMKPNITFFGEDLPNKFYKYIQVDRTSCDLLLVIGSSLKVRPVAEVPTSLPPHVPQILINRERLPHCTFDVELLGDSDVIVNQICHRLGESWRGESNCEPPLKRTKVLNRPSQLPPSTPCSTVTSPKTSRTDSIPEPFIDDEDFKMTNFSEDLIPSYTFESSLFDKETYGPSIDEMSSATIVSSAESEESNNYLENCTFSNSLSHEDESGDKNMLCSPFSPPRMLFDDGTDATTVSNDSMDFSKGESLGTLGYEATVRSIEGFEQKSFNELTAILKNGSDTATHSHTIKLPSHPERHSSIDSGINDDYDYAQTKVNVSDCLPENTFFLRPPNKYIFPGAEVKVRCKHLKFMK